MWQMRTTPIKTTSTFPPTSCNCSNKHSQAVLLPLFSLNLPPYVTLILFISPSLNIEPQTRITMNGNETMNPTLQQTYSRRKRKSPPAPAIKKLRSKIPRRKRFQISPIRSELSNALLPDTKPAESSVFQATSSCSSCFRPEQVSHTLGSDKLVNKLRSARRKKDIDQIRAEFHSDDLNAEKSRPITRSYLKQKALESQVTEDVGVELSESSCVESSTAAHNRVLCNSNLFSNQAEESEVAASAAPSLTDVSCIQTEIDQNVVESGEFAEKALIEVQVTEASAISPSDAKNQTEYDIESDLACSEHIDDSEYSSSSQMTLSELESEFFPRNSDVEFSSDFSPSLLMDSQSDFSQASPDSPPPAFFPLYLQYAEEFADSKLYPDIDASSEVPDKLTFMRFEDEENEESYNKFRNRERKIFLMDYAEEYCSTTEHGELVIKQRFLMVNWIIEQSKLRELQNETMFLAVSFLDRFLTQGFFKNKRNLEVLGIACLTLAIRIEENQPLNCVRQSAFYIENNGYSRCEVVAMEWMVQKVLDFKCFVPTIYNFLWFYLKKAKADAKMEKKAKYLAMLSLLDHEVLCYWPSTIAAGLVMLVCLAYNQDASSQIVMETHVRTKDDDLSECIQSLDWLLKHAR